MALDNLLYFPLRFPITMIDGWFFYTMLNLFLKPRSKNTHWKLYASMAYGIWMSFIAVFFPATMRAVLNTGAMLAAAFVVFKGHIGINILAYAAWYVCYIIAEASSLVFVSYLKWDVAAFTPFQAICIDAICCVLSTFVILIVRNAVRFVEDRLPLRLWGRLILAFFALICIVTIIFFDGYLLNDGLMDSWFGANSKLMNYIGMLLPVATFIVFLTAMSKLHETAIERGRIAYSERIAKAELEHSKAILEKNFEVRELRHDMQNHILAIETLAKNEDYTRMHRYIADLMSALDKTSDPFFCDHLIIDSLLYRFSDEIEKTGKKISIDSTPLKGSLAITDIDLCAIVGGLFDHVIAAFDKAADESVTVKLSCSENRFIIMIEYPVENGKACQTSDLRNIKTIAAQNSAQVSVTESRNIQCTEVSFPIK